MQACGAKTRAGSKCRRRPRSNGRCHLHGGKSLGWFAHPRYKHGHFSKYSLESALYRQKLRREAVWRRFEREMERRGTETPQDALELFRAINKLSDLRRKL
jgi:hypothetical protein